MPRIYYKIDRMEFARQFKQYMLDKYWPYSFLKELTRENDPVSYDIYAKIHRQRRIERRDAIKLDEHPNFDLHTIITDEWIRLNTPLHS